MLRAIWVRNALNHITCTNMYSVAVCTCTSTPHWRSLLLSLFSFYFILLTMRAISMPTRSWTSSDAHRTKFGKMRFIYLSRTNYFRHGGRIMGGMCVGGWLCQPDVDVQKHNTHSRARALSCFFLARPHSIHFIFYYYFRGVWFFVRRTIDVLSAVRYVFIYLFTFFPVISVYVCVCVFWMLCTLCHRHKCRHRMHNEK